MSATSAMMAPEAPFTMIGISLLLFFLISCGTSSKVEDVNKAWLPYVPAVYEQEIYGDINSYKVGQWVKYKIKKDDTVYNLTIKVVSKEADNFWQELIKELDSTRQISLRFVSREGVIKAYYWEGSFEPTTYVRPVDQQIDRQAADMRPQISLKFTNPRVESAMLEDWTHFDITHFKESSCDEYGQITRITYTYSEGIPLLFMTHPKYGAIIKLESEKFSIDLTGSGADAKPTMKIPPEQ